MLDLLSSNIVVAGIGTGVGKTVVSTILSLKYQVGYWKPIECGDSDSQWIKKFTSHVYEPTYRFHTPASPHIAAEIEGQHIHNVALPTQKPLIIEMTGGVLVPIRKDLLAIDYFSQFSASWILVSKNYLGSINHTLLTLEALEKRGIVVHALIFNGQNNRKSEEAICTFSHIKHVERLPKIRMTLNNLKKCGDQWTFGIPTHR